MIIKSIIYIRTLIFLLNSCLYKIFNRKTHGCQYAYSMMCTCITTMDPVCTNSYPFINRLVGGHGGSHTFVEIDNGIISTAINPLLLIQEGLLSVTSKSMCTKYGITA